MALGTVNLTGDLSGDIARAIGILHEPAALKIAARYVGNGLRKHFRAKEQIPNRRGFAPRSNFWAGIRSAVQENGATVEINDKRFNIHLYGGTVVPKTARALAIPMRSEAYQHPTNFFTDLFVRVSRGKAYLARRDGKKLTVYYLLLKSVYIRRDPTALPDMNLLLKEAGDAGFTHIQKKITSLF